MMAEWCIQFLVTVCLLLIADLISRSIMSGAYLLYYKLLSSNFLMLRSIPLGGGGGGAFVTFCDISCFVIFTYSTGLDIDVEKLYTFFCQYKLLQLPTPYVGKNEKPQKGSSPT